MSSAQTPTPSPLEASGIHEEILALRDCGAHFRAGRPYVGGEAVAFSADGAEALGREGFEITRGPGTARIAAATRVARLGAVLELAAMQRDGRRRLRRRLRFNHRNYKHEVSLVGAGPHRLEDYTEEFWIGLCRELVRRHFNGVLFYTHGTPFYAFGDFGRFRAYATLTDEQRAEKRRRFNRILAVCKRFGLETLLQQYVTKFPSRLGRACGIPFRQGGDPDAEVADFKHPVVYDFLRELYARFFRQIPDLDRLVLNFEAAPVSSEFMREVLLPTLSALPRVPKLFFRLWYLHNPRELCDWIEQYPAHCMVGHKIMETMDAYNYPAPDSRILDWRRIFDRRGLKVEWNYLMGPCHNCGSNISRRLWSDPEFLYLLLARARRLGADGINFHTVRELLANEFDSGAVVDAEERRMARLNQMHLETFVDFVRGGAFDEERVTARYAGLFRLKPSAARAAHRVLRDTSRAEILHLLQFPLTTHEGYAVDARRQLSQHPLYHPPANVLLNRQEREDPHPYWCFINKTVAHRSYPEDLQTLLDCADPSKARTARNPLRLAAEMERLGCRSHAAAQRLRGALGPLFARHVTSNRDLAAACACDIRAGVSLFGVYFARTRREACRHVEAAIRELAALRRIVETRGAPYIHMHEGHAPAPDLRALRRLRRHLGGNYPLTAFRLYAESRRAYNEIRRHVRPWRVWSDRTLRRAASLLRAARGAGRQALAAAQDSPVAGNLRRWVGFLEMELAWLRPPAFVCGRSPAPWQPLVHDNCFGYGGFAWADFLSFFEPLPFDKGLRLFCTVWRTDTDFVAEVREEGVDMRARRAHWKRCEGSVDETGFVRLFLDTDADGRKLRNWCIFPGGRHAVYREMLIGGRQDFDLRAARLAEGWRAGWRSDPRGWRLRVRIRFDRLGGPPAPGAQWRFNIAANTPIQRNHAVSWCKGYEVGPGNPARMGTVVFA